MKSDFGEDLLPVMKNVGDAGYDFKCPKTMVMIPGQWYDIDTGIHLEQGDIETDMHISLQPRSGTGTNYFLELANTVGTIDAGYRDSIKARIRVSAPNANLDIRECRVYWDERNGGDGYEVYFDEDVKIPVFILRRGDRFMQGIVLKHYYVAGLPKPSDTRDGGFGSTGMQ